MLAKLLKYDFKSLFKYWWIAAVTSLGLGVLAGSCFPVLLSEQEIPVILRISSVFVMIISFMGVGIFATFSIIMTFVRFYKNLFTDEGYLTFTLPVKRSHILNSKLISAVVLNSATYIVIILDIIIAISIGFGKEIYTIEAFKDVIDIVSSAVKELGVYLFVYILEVFLITIAFQFMYVLFLYICITIGSIITKKAKVITSIAIYYFANAIFSFVLQIFTMFGVASITEQFMELSEVLIMPVIALIMLCVLAFVLMICAALYVLEYYMLDRKLNLS